MRILKNTLFCVFVALLAVFISSCSEVICTTPYIVADDGCCLDEDGDGECGADKIEAKESVYSGEDIVYLVNESVENLGGEKVELEENLTVESEDTFGYFLGCSDCAINFVIYGDYQDSVTKKFNNEILPLLLEEYEELSLRIFQKIIIGLEGKLANQFIALEIRNIFGNTIIDSSVKIFSLILILITLWQRWGWMLLSLMLV